MPCQILQIPIGLYGLISPGSSASGLPGVVLAAAAVLRICCPLNHREEPSVLWSFGVGPGGCLAGNHCYGDRANLCRREFAASDRCFISTLPSACCGEPGNLNLGVNGYG